jgi:hypothetical protein
VSCFDAADGTIDFSGATGGYGTYEYSIDGGATWQSGTGFTNLAGSAAPGTEYNVQIQDAANPGCIIDLPNVFITQPDILTTVASSTVNYNTFGVSCGDISVGTINDGQVDATPAGGTELAAGGYNYSWSVISGGAIPLGQETLQNPSGLTAGTYEVLVTDANGCTITDQIIVTEPTILSLDAITPSVYAGGFNVSGCNPDGTLDLDISQGVSPYTFAWTGPSGFTSTDEDITGLSAGTYDVTITDDNGCTVTGQFIMTEPSGLGQTGTSFVYPNQYKEHLLMVILGQMEQDLLQQQRISAGFLQERIH